MFCSPSLSHLTHLRRVPNRRDWAGRDGLTDEREDSVSSAVISKGVNALSNRYSAPRKKISMNTKAITNICEELKGVQIKVKVRREKKRNGENVKKKKKRKSHAGLQRREDAGGYSRKWPLWLYGISDVQWRCKGRQFLSYFFSSRDHCRGQRETPGL